MAGNEDPDRLILPEPLHIGYITRDIERTKRNLQKMLGLESFTMRWHRLFQQDVSWRAGGF